ncbi:MAG: SMP-30/gluconolactonase/LRE family protein [Hyphomonadaceae bacterium]
MRRLKAELALASGDKIGESPFWDGINERLIWCDQEEGVINEARADGARFRLTRQWRIGRRVAAVVPRASGGLIVAAGLDVLALAPGDEISVLARIDDAGEGLSINEAKCDPSGRLWLGLMSATFAPGAGALYRLKASGEIERVLDGVTIANGMGWSSDARTMYFADSATRGIDAFDFDISSGNLVARRRFMTCEAGCPDGLTLDADDCVWVAVVGPGIVERVSPRGEILAQVSAPTPAVTSCAFGGAGGETLFITTLGRPLPEAAAVFGCSQTDIAKSARAPGHVFCCNPGVHGAGATAFAG